MQNAALGRAMTVYSPRGSFVTISIRFFSCAFSSSRAPPQHVEHAFRLPPLCSPSRAAGPINLHDSYLAPEVYVQSRLQSAEALLVKESIHTGFVTDEAWPFKVRFEDKEVRSEVVRVVPSSSLYLRRYFVCSENPARPWHP